MLKDVKQKLWDNNSGSDYHSLLSLRTLNNAIDWTKFDEYSGVFVLQIIDLENEIIWYNLKGVEIRKTNFKELYNLFSCK